MSSHAFRHHLKHVQEKYDDAVEETIQNLQNEYTTLVNQLTSDGNGGDMFSISKNTLKKEWRYLKSAIDLAFEICALNHELLFETKLFENNTLTFYDFFNEKIFPQSASVSNHFSSMLHPVEQQKLNIMRNTLDTIKRDRTENEDHSISIQKDNGQQKFGQWPPQKSQAERTVNVMVQVYNGDKHYTRFSMDNFAQSICELLHFFYHFETDEQSKINIFIEISNGYIKVSNIFSELFRHDLLLRDILFKKVVSQGWASFGNTKTQQKSAAIGGSSLIDVYVLGANLETKETIPVDIAYRHHNVLLERLDLPTEETNLLHVREMIYGITLRHAEDGNDEDSDSESSDSEAGDGIEVNVNPITTDHASDEFVAEVEKSKFEILSRLNQKQNYRFSHCGVFLREEDEMQSSAVGIAIDEGCQHMHNGVIQAEDLILLIDDEV